MISPKDSNLISKVVALIESGSISGAEAEFCNEVICKIVNENEMYPALQTVLETALENAVSKIEVQLVAPKKMLVYRIKNTPKPDWNVGDWSRVYQMFKDAIAAGLTSPRMVMAATYGQEYEIKLYNLEPVELRIWSKYSGYLYLAIQETGECSYIRDSLAKNPSLREALLSMVVDLGVNPLGAIKKSADISGKCPFCNKKLPETALKTGVGFGPTCGKKYGLVAGYSPKTVVKKAKVLEVESAIDKAVANLVKDAPHAPPQEIVPTATNVFEAAWDSMFGLSPNIAKTASTDYSQTEGKILDILATPLKFDSGDTLVVLGSDYGVSPPWVKTQFLSKDTEAPFDKSWAVDLGLALSGDGQDD